MFDKDFFEAVKNGVSYKGHYELTQEYDWTILHKLLDAGCEDKVGKKSGRHNIHIPIIHEHIIHDAKLISNEMRKYFYNHLIDAQIFANKNLNPSKPHRDTMDVFFMPLCGVVTVGDQVLHPGDWMWYPRGFEHNIVPIESPRVSLSIGVDKLKTEELYQEVLDKDPVNPKNYYTFEKELNNEIIEEQHTS